MRRMLLCWLAGIVFLGVGQPASAQTVPYPDSMASTGDSITRAFNSSVLPFVDAPWNSWSTGSNGAVQSHYRRILAANPAIFLRNFNDARSGAEMADLPAQVELVNAQHVEYVTVSVPAEGRLQARLFSSVARGSARAGRGDLAGRLPVRAVASSGRRIVASTKI
jgi:hypothetical protein